MSNLDNNNNDDNNDTVELDYLIPYIKNITFNYIPYVPKNILIKCKDLISLEGWCELSSKNCSKDILMSPKLFNYIKWECVIGRMQLNTYLIDKILKERLKKNIVTLPILLSRVKISIEQFYELKKNSKPHSYSYSYSNSNSNSSNYYCVDANSAITFLVHQNINLDVLRNLVKVYDIKDKHSILLISCNTSLKFDPFKDTDILNFINPRYHLRFVQYSSYALIHKFLMHMKIDELLNILQTTGEFLSFQKDITQNLCDYIFNLLRANNVKNIDSVVYEISVNPNVNLRKNKLLENNISKGCNIRLAKLVVKRKLPLWFIDRYFFLIPHDMLFQIYKFDKHFLTRQIRKYLDPDSDSSSSSKKIRNDNPQFLEHLVLYNEFDIPFLRALCDLIIILRLPTEITKMFWIVLSSYQKLDFKFIHDYIKYLNPLLIQSSQEITVELIELLKHDKTIDWKTILLNDTFYNLDEGTQLYYATDISQVPTLKNILAHNNHMQLWKNEKKNYIYIEVVSAMYYYRSLNQDPYEYIKYFQKFQQFLKPHERLDFAHLKPGQIYTCECSNSEHDFKGFVPQYITPVTITPATYTGRYDSIPNLLNDHNTAKIIYQNNPILCQYPTYLKIKYYTDDVISDNTSLKYSIIYNKLPVFDRSKERCIRSFKVINVKYITDDVPFELSIDDC